MSVSFSNRNTHTRSGSFPPKSNLMVDKIELELKKLAKAEEVCTSEIETINTGLTGVARLYKCVDRALKTRHLQAQTQAQFQAHRINPLIDTSSKLLEICTTSRQMLTSLRQEVAGLRSHGDIHGGGDGGEKLLSSYVAARRETMTSSKTLAISLSQLERLAGENLDRNESEVSRVLTSVTIINISVLRTLFRFMMTKPRARPARLLYALGFKKKVTGKAATLPAKNGNKLTDVDAALNAAFGAWSSNNNNNNNNNNKGNDGDALAVALKRLEAMEVALLEFEEGLSFIFNVLSSIKASLLNIISLYV